MVDIPDRLKRVRLKVRKNVERKNGGELKKRKTGKLLGKGGQVLPNGSGLSYE